MYLATMDARCAPRTLPSQAARASTTAPAVWSSPPPSPTPPSGSMTLCSSPSPAAKPCAAAGWQEWPCVAPPPLHMPAGAGAGLVGSLPARKIAPMTLFFGFPPVFPTAGLAFRYPAMDTQSMRALALRIMLVTSGAVRCTYVGGMRGSLHGAVRPNRSWQCCVHATAFV